MFPHSDRKPRFSARTSKFAVPVFGFPEFGFPNFEIPEFYEDLPDPNCSMPERKSEVVDPVSDLRFPNLEICVPTIEHLNLGPDSISPE